MKPATAVFVFLLAFAAANAQDRPYLKEHADTIYYKGAKEIKHPKSQDKRVKGDPVELKRNIVSLNILDPVLQNITFSVEFIPGKGKTSIVMPITFFSPLGKVIENASSSDMGKYHKDLATYIRAGFDINYYPYGQKKYSYFTGASLQGAYLKRQTEVLVDEGQGIYQGLYFYFLNKQGLTMTFKEHFCITLGVSWGVKTPDLQQYYFGILGNVGIGARF